MKIKQISRYFDFSNDKKANEIEVVRILLENLGWENFDLKPWNSDPPDVIAFQDLKSYCFEVTKILGERAQEINSLIKSGQEIRKEGLRNWIATMKKYLSPEELKLLGVYQNWSEQDFLKELRVKIIEKGQKFKKKLPENKEKGLNCKEKILLLCTDEFYLAYQWCKEVLSKESNQKVLYQLEELKFFDKIFILFSYDPRVGVYPIIQIK